jgi:hypothetical protein
MGMTAQNQQQMGISAANFNMGQYGINAMNMLSSNNGNSLNNVGLSMNLINGQLNPTMLLNSMLARPVMNANMVRGRPTQGGLPINNASLSQQNQQQAQLQASMMMANNSTSNFNGVRPPNN